MINNFFVKLDLFSIKAPYSKKSLVAYFPIFWFWVFVKLIFHRPEIVHALDLDTVMPCYLYKLIFRKKLVFDVIDRISMSRISPKNVILYSLVNHLEEFYSKLSDVLVSVTEKLLNTFKKKPKHYSLIMNCAENQIIDNVKPQNGILTLYCPAPVSRTQGLGKITEAMHDLKGVELVYAGRVLDEEFHNLILQTPNVKYKGILLPEEALSLGATSDVIISLYDLDVPNYHVALPVKTFDAMMLGKPVISNIAHELIDEVGCGIEVDWNDISKIKNAVIKLRDDSELRKKLGENGRKAFEQKYSWEKMEKRLFNIYDNLLRKND